MKKMDYDIVIVAAGPSGLSAAVTAAEHGMSVGVLEKADVPGGTANMGMGPFGVESHLQKMHMVNLRKEEAFRLMMEYTHWRVDARKVREYMWKSGDTINWLEKLGVQFSQPAKYFPSAYATWHTVVPEGGGKPGPRSASAMNKVMYEAACEMGVEFFFHTPATELVMEGGEAVGVRAKDLRTEEEYELYADAVIVATGGFGDSPEMIRELCGYEYGEDMLNTRVPGITGDGLRMVWAAGGMKGRIEMERILASKIELRSMLHLFQQPTVLMVNIDGERVADEAVVENYSVMSNVCDRQPQRKLISILDENLLHYYRENGVDFPSGVHAGDPTDDFENVFSSAMQQWPNDAFTADSPAQLAEKIGINPAALEQTMSEYNTMCQNRLDDYFCKDQRWLRPLSGKLYAVVLTIGAYGSLGGIQVNYKFQVINTEGKPIPGLYASGSDTCDIYGDTYLFTLPGNTMGYAVNSGRLAAERAVEFLQSFE